VGSSILILISTQRGSFVPLDRTRENAQIVPDNGRLAQLSSPPYRDLLHITLTFDIIRYHLFQLEQQKIGTKCTRWGIGRTIFRC